MGMIDMTEGEADYLKYRFKQYLGSVSREIQNRRLKEQKKMGMSIDKTETFIEHSIMVDSVQVGTVELCPERMEISRLNIFEPYQNKGYGTEVVKNLVKQGYKSLWVRADNARALHVYEKCGFVKKEATMFEMEIKDGNGD